MVLMNADYLYWDIYSTARETYRSSVRLGPDGAEGYLAFAELETILEIIETKVDSGIQRALAMNQQHTANLFYLSS